MKSEEELYQKLFTLLKLYRFDEFYSIGEKFGQHNAKFQLFKNTHFKTSLELKEFLKQHPPENTSILIKGARIFKLEEICALLQQKIHETTLEVNLSAVAKNYTFFKQKLRQGTKIMGMVKAFSYGSGAVEIASLLETMQIDYLAVAYVDEGIELRKNGIKTPIMVMKPDDNAFVLMQEFNLEPVIYNQLILNKLNAYTSISGNTITAHLEVDSGMNRLGFELNEIDDAIAIFKKNKQLKISSVFSHLAASDEPDFDGFTHEQIDSFKLEVEKIKNVLPYPILVHLCNSNAILRFPEAHFDMVRLGIGMFGTAVVASSADALQPVATLKTNIAQIRTVFPNESVGYNRNGKVNKISKIASIPIGYADGILRKAGNGNATFLVNGKPCPTIGNICMDLCMIDVTEVDCKEGDVVIVFSPEFPIENLAKSLETIPYEVLTNISQRVKRVYYEE
jgi:alanine racemase